MTVHLPLDAGDAESRNGRSKRNEYLKKQGHTPAGSGIVPICVQLTWVVFHEYEPASHGGGGYRSCALQY